MADENLLATLESSLRQTRATRARLASRLFELELESEKLRTEIGEMEAIASQTEAAMFRIMSSMLGSGNGNFGVANQSGYAQSVPSDAQIEAALRQDAARVGGGANGNSGGTTQAGRMPNAYAPSNALSMNATQANASAVHEPRAAVPPVRDDVEAQSDRFLDRTIPQATALILREAGAALHVNEIYNRLLEGGFQFSGQNPTISIAVSLNRNRRFRKVAPGTFDMTIRDAAQAS